MSKIPTAEDFLQDSFTISHFYDDKTDRMVCFADDVKKAMIEFAKLTVQAALEVAYNNADIVCGRKTKKDCKQCMGGGCEKPIIDKDSILNSYPLNNIK